LLVFFYDFQSQNYQFLGDQQIPFPLLLPVIARVFGLVSEIGATLGISLISLILLSQNVWLSLKVLVARIVLQQIQNNWLTLRLN